MNLRENHSLKAFNTFGIDVRASYFLEVTSQHELISALQDSFIRQNKLLVLGGGSNILLQNDFDGIVIKNSISGYEIVKEEGVYSYVKVGGGEDWHQLVLKTLDQNLGGLENLSLIPGTVGASPMQNIGAYGVEVKDVFAELTAVEISNGTAHVFGPKDCEFDYRSSVFKTRMKGQFIITSVTYRLTNQSHELQMDYGAIRQTLQEWKVERPTIKNISDAVVAIRQSKLPDPAEIGNSGSFFKNPVISKADFEQLAMQFKDMPGYPVNASEVKVPAAWLIEKCGWKGHREGNCGVHKNHALVLVNYGGARGNDIWELARKIQTSVKGKFGIELHPEVNLVG